MLVDPSSGKALSQKRYPRMALIKPSIDLDRGVLTVKAKGMEDLVLPLPELAGLGTPPLSSTSSDGDSIDIDQKSTLLCGELVTSSRVSPLADRWFATFLNLPHIQLRRLPLDSTSRHAHFNSSPSSLPTAPLPLRLSNESPFLLVTESSVRQVNDWISADSTDQVHHTAFRPNLIIDDLDLSIAGQVDAFWEDEADLVKIGELVFANLGRCRRCLMVGINQVSTVPPYHSRRRVLMNRWSRRSLVKGQRNRFRPYRNIANRRRMVASSLALTCTGDKI